MRCCGLSLGKFVSSLQFHLSRLHVCRLYLYLFFLVSQANAMLWVVLIWSTCSGYLYHTTSHMVTMTKHLFYKLAHGNLLLLLQAIKSRWKLIGLDALEGTSPLCHPGQLHRLGLRRTSVVKEHPQSYPTSSLNLLPIQSTYLLPLPPRDIHDQVASLSTMPKYGRQWEHVHLSIMGMGHWHTHVSSLDKETRKEGGWIGSLKPILWLFLIYTRKILN